MAVVAAGFLTVFLLGVVIRVQTNYGTVKIEIPDAIANLAVKLDGDTISIEGLGDPLRLRPGAHELVVTGNGCETVCTSFTVGRGSNPPLTVTLVEKPPASRPPQPDDVFAKDEGKSTDPLEMATLPIQPAVVPPAPSPENAAAHQEAKSPQLTKQTLPTPQQFLTRDLSTSLVPLVELSRQAVREQDWELAQKMWCPVAGGCAARRTGADRGAGDIAVRRAAPRPARRAGRAVPARPGRPRCVRRGAGARQRPKASPPNPVDHDRISKEVQQNFGPEYRKAQTDQQKKVFAEGILNAARSTTDPKDPAHEIRASGMGFPLGRGGKGRGSRWRSH